MREDAGHLHPAIHPGKYSVVSWIRCIHVVRGSITFTGCASRFTFSEYDLPLVEVTSGLQCSLHVYKLFRTSR
jgi:hypothetical protein